MSAKRNPIQAVALLIFILIVFSLVPAALVGGFAIFVLPVIFFVAFVLVIVVIAVNASMRARGSRIQRPLSEQTAFAPPPPPDTVLVKCPYCQTNQPFSEKCVNCGGPLPKPGFY